MKPTSIIYFAAFGVSFAKFQKMTRSTSTWIAPTSSDSRSPCPMLNTLANHGILPHDGRNISMADLVTAMNSSVNLNEVATRIVGAKALTATLTTGRTDTFNLEDVRQHGIIEHDASLSRTDFYTGDNFSFNSTIWAGMMNHFPNSSISIADAAAGRQSRIVASSLENPTFNMTAADANVSLLESALYMVVFDNGKGNGEATAEREWVNVLFSEERLPYEEGWTRPATAVTVATVQALGVKIAAAS